MGGTDLEPDHIVDDAAAWLLRHRHELDGNVVATIRTRFGVSTLDAVAAIRQANRLRANFYSQEARYGGS